MRLLPFGPCALLLATACIVEAPTGGGSASSSSTSSTSSTGRTSSVVNATPISFKLGANLGDNVEVVSAQVTPGQVAPGEQARITLFFKVLEPLPQDYLVFIHVEDVDGRTERMNLDHAPAGGQYPTSQWKKGEVVKDEFVFYVPPGASVRGFNLWGGLWEPRSDTRLPIKNPGNVRNDGNNRLLLAQVPILR